MYSISDIQFSTEIEPIFRKVFIRKYPFGRPFSPSIAVRAITYPIFESPEPPFLEALIKAASLEGDKGCYLTLYWQSEGEPNHCYIPFSELIEGFTSSTMGKGIEKTLNMTIIPEYTLFSEQGKWGLMVSDEHHGMLGGSSKFIQVFHEKLPNFENQVYDFLEVMQNLKPDGSYKKLDWLLEMLTHVYGEDEGNKILEKMNKRISNN